MFWLPLKFKYFISSITKLIQVRKILKQKVTFLNPILHSFQRKLMRLLAKISAISLYTPKILYSAADRLHSPLKHRNPAFSAKLTRTCAPESQPRPATFEVRYTSAFYFLRYAKKKTRH